PHWLSHGGRSYLHDPCGCSPFFVAVCGPLRCASAQPLALCLLAGELAYTALDGEGWRCVGVPVWGSRAFVHDTSADKLSTRAIPCVFLGFSPEAPGWKFFHPTSRRVFLSQDVKFDESVPFYQLFPYRSASPPPPPLFLPPGPPPVDPLPPQGPAPSGVSHVDPLPNTVPVEVAVDPGTAQGAASGGAASGVAASGGAEPGGVEPGGAKSEGAGSGDAEPAGVESGGAEPEGVEPGGAESGCAEPRGTASSGGPAGASPRLSPQPELLSPKQLHEWLTQRTRLRSGAIGAEDSAAGDTRVGGAGVTAGAGGTGGAAAAGPGGARTRCTGAGRTGSVGGAGAGDSTEPGAARAGGTRAGGTGAGVVGARGAGAVGYGAGGTGAGGAGAGGAGAVDLGAGGAGALGAVSGGTGAGGTVRPRTYFVPLFQQPASALPAPSPYTAQNGGLTEHCEPASRSPSPVRTGRRVPRQRPPPVPGTHAMALRPSSVPLHVPLPPPPESSLPAVPDPESDHARAASPTVSRLLATVVTDPSIESTAASALVAELVDFAAACRLDYATAIVAESESASSPSVGGECALGTVVLEDRQEDFECLAAAAPRFASMLFDKSQPHNWNCEQKTTAKKQSRSQG
ncbi:unnamed protein product, partial [Closterium sp. NIES-53]